MTNTPVKFTRVFLLAQEMCRGIWAIFIGGGLAFYDNCVNGYCQNLKVRNGHYRACPPGPFAKTAGDSINWCLPARGGLSSQRLRISFLFGRLQTEL